MKAFVIVCKLFVMVALGMAAYSTAIPELYPVTELPPEFYCILTHPRHHRKSSGISHRVLFNHGSQVGVEGKLGEGRCRAAESQDRKR